jgi:hypothetical protein
MRLTDIVDATKSDLDQLRKRVFCDALAWSEEEGGSVIVGGKVNRVVRLLSFILYRPSTSSLFVFLSFQYEYDVFLVSRRTQRTRYST